MKPLLLINLKAYEQGTGAKALSLAKIAERVAKKTGGNIVVAVQPTDIHMISKAVSIPVYSQHVDPVDYGAYTGSVLPEAVKQAGAKGTLINHAEKRIDIETIKKTIYICKGLGLVTVVCVPDVAHVDEVAHLDPDFVAFEDPELIGSGKPISEVEPENVRKFAQEVKKMNPKIISLCGAGIVTKHDTAMSIKLGMHGVLVASAIVKAQDQEKEISELVHGFGK
jgi:triosephosphate isomerase